MGQLSRLVAAWPQVARRALANWRLMSTVVVGVLLASAIMAGSVIYFDALRELALRNVLNDLTVNETNILVKSDRGPTTYAERDKVVSATEREIEARVAWLLRDSAVGVKTSTFFLSAVGREAEADTDSPRAYFGHLPRLYEYATLQPGGRAPGDAPARAVGGIPTIEAAVPLEAARDIGATVGDTFAAVPYWSDSSPYIHVVITGTFTRDDPDHEYWHLDDRILRAATARTFQTLPFYVSEKAYYEVLGGAFRQMDSTFGWLLMTDSGKLNAANSTFARYSVNAMEDRLSALLFSYRQITELDEVLFEYDRRLFFSKLPMFVILILISIVILYYVITLSSLVVEQQRGEIVLLKSRGSSSTQVLSVYVLEGLTIAALAIVVAPLLAATVISLLGLTPAFSDLSGGRPLAVSVSPAAYLMSGLGGLLSFAALMVPAVQASRMSVTTYRRQSARPYDQPFYQRYYLDVLLLIVSLLLLRQLTEQGSVVVVGVFGEVAADQLLLAAPAIALVASALVLLRLFPLFMRVSSALLSSVLSAGLVLGIWQMARNPTHYARLSLMLILMAGLGIFAASFGGTLQRSFSERALYSTGTDVRLSGALVNSIGESVPIRGAYQSLPGVEDVSLAFRGFGSDLSKLLADSYTMFAVEGDAIADMGWFRDDFSEEPLRDMLTSLGSDTLPAGIDLPPTAQTLGITVKADRPHPTVALALRMRDSNGRYFTYVMGRLETARWVTMRQSIRRSGFRELAVLQPAAAADAGFGDRTRDQRAKPAARRLDSRGRSVRRTAGWREGCGRVIRHRIRMERPEGGARSAVRRAEAGGRRSRCFGRVERGRRRRRVVHLGRRPSPRQSRRLPRPAARSAARTCQQPLPARQRPPRRRDVRSIRAGPQDEGNRNRRVRLLPDSRCLRALVHNRGLRVRQRIRQSRGRRRRVALQRGLDDDQWLIRRPRRADIHARR